MPNYTKKTLHKAIDKLRAMNVPVYYKETKTTLHIYSIGNIGTSDVQERPQKELTRELFTMAGMNTRDNPAERPSTRPYTYHSLETERRHLQVEEKKLTSSYKAPLAPTIKTRIERISSTGKKYHTYIEAQDIELEKEYRKTAREYNRASRNYAQAQKDYEELVKFYNKRGTPLTKEERAGLKAVEDKLAETPEISGRMRKEKFKEYAKERGPEGARLYVQQMAARAKGMVTLESMVDVRVSFDVTIRKIERAIEDGANLDYDALMEAMSKFWGRHADGMKWTDKEELLDAMKSGGNEDWDQERINNLTALINSL